MLGEALPGHMRGHMGSRQARPSYSNHPHPGKEPHQRSNTICCELQQQLSPHLRELGEIIIKGYFKLCFWLGFEAAVVIRVSGKPKRSPGSEGRGSHQGGSREHKAWRVPVGAWSFVRIIPALRKKQAEEEDDQFILICWDFLVWGIECPESR